MSSDASLDLASSPVAPTAMTATAPAVEDDLVLTPPAAVKPIPTEKASTMLPLSESTASALSERARNYVANLAALDPRAPEFAKKIDDISKLGNTEIRASSAVSNRMLERPVAALAGARGEAGDGQQKVANTLVQLRRQVEDLDPGRNDVTGVKKLLGMIPFGDKLRDYFAKYASAQHNLNKIIQALMSGQDELRKDNASIEGEKKNLWDMMNKLQEYAVLAASLDAALDDHIDTVAASDPQKANQLKADMLFAVRQKHQDLLTQLAVAAQGYLALEMVRKNNIELIKGVDRATTTTVAALRTAVIVAQALANQKLVLDQITALNTTTGNLILATSQMLKQQTSEIHTQAASSTVSVEVLKEAFNNIYETIDTIDTFKAQAVDNMAVTVDALRTEITRAGEYLERQRATENAPTI